MGAMRNFQTVSYIGFSEVRVQNDAHPVPCGYDVFVTSDGGKRVWELQFLYENGGTPGGRAEGRLGWILGRELEDAAA